MSEQQFEVVIVGAGAAGIAVASSLKKRQADLKIALIDRGKALLPTRLDDGGRWNFSRADD